MINAEKKINKEFNLPAENFGFYTQIKSVLIVFGEGSVVSENSTTLNQNEAAIEVMNCIVKKAFSPDKSFKSLLVSSQNIKDEAINCIDVLFQNNQLLPFTTSKLEKEKNIFGANLLWVILFRATIPTRE